MRICRAASMPLMPGMWTSISTASYGWRGHGGDRRLAGRHGVHHVAGAAQQAGDDNAAGDDVLDQQDAAVRQQRAARSVGGPPASRHPAAGASIGSDIQNSLPARRGWPIGLSSIVSQPTAPPISVASSRQIASPRPLPGCTSAPGWSSWENGSEQAHPFSGCRSGPWSRTARPALARVGPGCPGCRR